MSSETDKDKSTVRIYAIIAENHRIVSHLLSFGYYDAAASVMVRQWHNS